MSLYVICRYYNIPLVSLIKMLKFWSLHSVELSITVMSKRWGCWLPLVYAQFMGIQSHHHSWLHCVQVHGDIQSHHHGWLHCCAGARGHPVTSSQLTSLCAGAWGHPVTLSQLTSSICQGQSRSGYYQVPSLRVSLGLHFFNEPGWWLTVPSRMVRGSRCYAGELWCHWLCCGRCVHSGCLPWSAGVLQLVEVLQVQCMVLVALPGWQVGVWA